MSLRLFGDYELLEELASGGPLLDPVHHGYRSHPCSDIHRLVPASHSDGVDPILEVRCSISPQDYQQASRDDRIARFSTRIIAGH